MTKESAPSVIAPSASTQSALESPTESIRVVKPRAWLALVACLVLAVCVIAWSMIVQIPISASTPSAVLPGGSLVSVTSPAEGRLVSFDVEIGAEVSKGQQLATLLDTNGKVVKVDSPMNGWVGSTFGTSGSIVHVGSPVANLQFESGPLVLRMFPDPTVAQQLAPGSQVIVEVVGEGSARATFTTKVSKIGEPITASQAESLVGDDALTSMLVGDLPVVTPVEADLDVQSLVDELEAQSFPTNDESGGSSYLATSTFIIGTKHPIEYVFGSQS